jgi:hypothetical protein
MIASNRGGKTATERAEIRGILGSDLGGYRESKF